MAKQVRLACIASGSGTDFESIAKAWKAGWLPEISAVVLISTKEGAGCLAKADNLGIRHLVVNPENKHLSTTALLLALAKLGGADIIFLVGCIVRVSDVGIPVYNIHPANTRRHGGKTMYGLAVHKHVLAEVIDEIVRGWKKSDQDFYTEVTVHDANAPYDQGEVLLTLRVQIPPNLINRLLKKTLHPKRAAQMLQRHVLTYEHLLLSVAVRAAAKKILD